MDEFNIDYYKSEVNNIEISELIKTFKKDDNIGAVYVGFDQYFNYTKMAKAATYLASEKVIFIATNNDEPFMNVNSNRNIILPSN